MRLLARFWFLAVDESGAAAGVGAVPAGQGAVLALYWRSVGAWHGGAAGAGKACCVSLEPLHIVWINPCSAGDQIKFVVVDMSYFSLGRRSLFPRNGLCAKPALHVCRCSCF